MQKGGIQVGKSCYTTSEKINIKEYKFGIYWVKSEKDTLNNKVLGNSYHNFYCKAIWICERKLCLVKLNNSIKNKGQTF